MGQTPLRPLSMNVEFGFMHSSYIAMEFDRNWNKSQEQGEGKNKVVVYPLTLNIFLHS
jgi:hypothetical protein